MIIKTQRSMLRRRAFLGGIGTATIALPFLEGLPERSAWAAGSTNPIYGFFICTSCGVVQQSFNEPERFWPTQVGSLTRESMQADAAERCTGLLAEHAERLLVVRGVNYPFPNTGCGHAMGLVQCLTGARPNGTSNSATSSGPSIDSFIAQQLSPGEEPLTLYSGLKQGFIDEKLSFSEAGRVRGAEGNPWNTYQRMMGLIPAGGGGGNGGGAVEGIVLRRQSVIDLVKGELDDLRSRSDLSQADHDRLDLHFTSIRDAENTMVAMGVGCSEDGLDIAAMERLNTGMAFRADGTAEEVSKLQFDLVALAFACNAARVATIQIGDGTDATRYVIDGRTVERFHYISHRIQSDGTMGAAIPEAVEWHTAIDRMRMESFKYLLDRWSEVTTPNGPLLDNAFAMWTSHIAVGPSHSFNNLPVLIAGNAGGFLKTGQYVDAGGATNNRLLNTLATAMGAPTTSFGDPSLPGGLIDEMLA